MTGTDDSGRLGETRDAAMRADIHLLGDLLGHTLVRQHGAGLLELVERVRSLSKRARDGGGDHRAAAQLDALLAGLDIADTTNLARAFSTFFHLANVAEQTHRVDEHGPRSGIARGRLRALFDHIEADDAQRNSLREVAAQLEVRPVFTAHPTEAARRSVLTKLQRVGELLYEQADRASDRGGPGAHPAAPCRGRRPGLADRRTARPPTRPRSTRRGRRSTTCRSCCAA